MRALLDFSLEELTTLLKEPGQPALRARQIHRWVFAGRASSFAEMTDLPKALREQLTEQIPFWRSRIDRHLQSSDGTQKLLLRLPDDQLVECVLLYEEDRRTVCISTQVGCGMGCAFCASGLNGLVRNLTTTEILEQLLLLRNLLPANERLSHVVVMGMGEPLANLDNLLAALEVVTTPCEGTGKGRELRYGLGISARHITISTVGLPAKIRKLADQDKQYHLAVSLHAPNEEIRAKIVPTEEKTGLREILDAADYFYARARRQVTYEYVLLRGINDQPEHAEELATLLAGRKAHINLIPFNDVQGLPYQRPYKESIKVFLDILRERGLVVHVRKRKGADIDAACGQLRRTVQNEREPLLSLTPSGRGEGQETRGQRNPQE